MENLIIYGNGKIAKIIYHFLKNHFNIVAFTVNNEFIKELSIEKIPVEPFENIEKSYSINKHKMIIAVGYVQMNNVREQKYIEAKEKGYQFVNYIHHSVDIHDNIIIGENNIILDHVTIQPYASIGNNNFIWSNAVVAHGSTVGDTNWITSGVVIAGDSNIKSKCFLGVNATIAHNIVVENENFIGANTLISKDTKEKEVFISKEGEKFRLDSHRFLQFAGV